ncbi:MAG: hypothetical protein B7Z66_12965 [Chromatiales bacterium 21-64-14]|nr:MAG: hypothetical protein B7Z66_12965 [Chromatiales bacterium 21-64-14]HQU16372.1 hypothetical protein [Gammaproteobacteria bacterium]
MSRSSSDGFGGAAVLNVGPDAGVTALSGISNTGQFDAQQACRSYPTGPASLAFGKMAALIGVEVIPSPNDWNFPADAGFVKSQDTLAIEGIYRF